MGDEQYQQYSGKERDSVETLVSNPSESDDFSLGECNLFDIEDSFYEKSNKFSGFWKLHGSILWKDKAIPTISIDGLQSSLHKWENSNLLSLKIEKTKEAKTDQKPTRNERDKNKSEETARNQKPDQPDTARNEVKSQIKSQGPIMTSVQRFKGYLEVVAETFDWDEEEVFDDEKVTQVKVLMALADDELTVGKSHACNGEWVDITIRKLNHALQEQLKEEKKINEKWLTSSKKVSQCISEKIPSQKKKVLGGELFTESSSKVNENKNLFVPASMRYDQEMVPKTKDWVERLNPDNKLPNFNTGRILVPESQAVNESLKLTETSNTPEDSEAEFLTLLPPLKILQVASPSSEELSLLMNLSKTPSVPTEVKDTEQESKLNELTKLVQMLIDEKTLNPKFRVLAHQNHSDPSLFKSHNLSVNSVTIPIIQLMIALGLLYLLMAKGGYRTFRSMRWSIASLKRSENYKAQPYQYASSSKQILRAKAKPFPPCTHCGFNDHIPGDCRNYHECGISLRDC
ncbi:hypothetical protein Tco_0594148 [Tanacetum coccineum]